MVVDPSPAVLYRLVEKWKPTLIVDEADDQFKENPPLRAVVNSGWTRGAGVPRCNPDTNEPEIFPTFGPKAIGMKGHSIPTPPLADPSLSRCSARSGANSPPTLSTWTTLSLIAMRQQLARWAEDNFEALRRAQPTMSKDFHNRLAVKLAASAGDSRPGRWEWPTLARDAAVALAPKGTSSIGTTLLEDIQAIFAEKRTDRLASAEIAEALHAIEGRPWSEWGRSGKPISSNQVARLLKEFVIVSGTIRTEHGTPKGYYLHQFADAFERYLDPPRVSETPQRHNACGTGTSEPFQNATPNPNVADEKCENPLRHSDCGVVAVQKRGEWPS